MDFHLRSRSFPFHSQMTRSNGSRSRPDLAFFSLLSTALLIQASTGLYLVQNEANRGPRVAWELQSVSEFLLTMIRHKHGLRKEHISDFVQRF